MSTTAGSVIGSVIDIGNATRVNLGMRSPPLPSSQHARFPPGSPTTMMGQVISPSTAGSGSLAEQQQAALAHAQARAEEIQGGKRVSGSSMFTAASMGGDSILEAFPFVPPSPISDRPMRNTPPSSPLVQQSFNPAQAPGSKPTAAVRPPQAPTPSRAPPPVPLVRKTHLSTASQFSTASSGLGNFPFVVEDLPPSPMPPLSATGSGRVRASLDTLALTADLSSYPLGFDHEDVKKRT